MLQLQGPRKKENVGICLPGTGSQCRRTATANERGFFRRQETTLENGEDGCEKVIYTPKN